MSDAALNLPAPVAHAAEQAEILPLRVRDLEMGFDGTPVFDGLSLDLGSSGCTAIMGPNGAGKSVLLKLLHGLMAPDHGTIDWGGVSPEDARARQALVFQKPVSLRRSVTANVAFVLRVRGKDPARSAELLAHVGLAHKAGSPARRLSGGEAQRLALARALATDPEVLFLDEPTASLDPASVLAIEAILREARDRGMRVVLVTHDVGQARRLADEVVFLHRGQVAEQSSATAFFDRPKNQAARDYLDGRIVV